MDLELKIVRVLIKSTRNGDCMYISFLHYTGVAFSRIVFSGWLLRHLWE